jgi:hypothetical protein
MTTTYVRNDAGRFRAPATEFRPIWMPDEKDPDVFTLVIEFSHGERKSWQIKAPSLPIVESWIRSAMQGLIERIVDDLRYGHSQPECRPDKRAFQEFDRHAEGFTRALHDMLTTWARWRIERYRKRALPAWKFKEDPDADTGVDSGWRPPMVTPGEPTPEGY